MALPKGLVRIVSDDYRLSRKKRDISSRQSSARIPEVTSVLG